MSDRQGSSQGSTPFGEASDDSQAKTKRPNFSGLLWWVFHSGHTIFITWVFLVWFRLIPVPDVGSFFFAQTAVAFVLAKNLTNVVEEKLDWRKHRLAWESKSKHRVVMTTVCVVTDLYLSYIWFRNLADDLWPSRIAAAVSLFVYSLVVAGFLNRAK